MTYFKRSSLKLVIIENPGRSSLIRLHPALISLTSPIPNKFGDDKKGFEVSPMLNKKYNLLVV